MSVDDDAAGARAATAGLLEHLDRLDNLTALSLLPGWTRADVVAHLTGNARSHVRMLDGCLAGEVVAQYPVAEDGRTAEIEALAADPGAVIAAHREACAELDARWTAMTPGALAAPRPAARHGAAAGPRAGLLALAGVEVHRVDLSADDTPADWDRPFTDRLLAGLLGRPDLANAGRRRRRGTPGRQGCRAARQRIDRGAHGLADGPGRRPAGRGRGALPEIPAWT